MDSTFLAKHLNTSNLADTLINFGLKMLGAVIVLILGLLLIKAILSVTRSTLKRTVPDVTVRQYSLSSIRIVLWTVLALIILGVFGIETTSILTILGAVGIAIGLALQGTLSNLAAGLMLLLFRPFKADDEVEVATVTGKVVEIGIFSTIVDMPDNVRAFVPNGMIFTGIVKNRSINQYIRLELRVTLAEDTDITRAQQLIQRMLSSNELIAEVPPPEVQVVEAQNPGITLAIRPYTRLSHSEAVRTMVAKEVREVLRWAEMVVVKQ